MPRLIFDRGALEREVALTSAARTHRKLFDEDVGPALWLVGDRGVYLMGNQERVQGAPPNVVYAAGCDPATDAGWAKIKWMCCGQDDDCQALPLDDIASWLAEAKGMSRVTVALQWGPDELFLLDD